MTLKRGNPNIKNDSAKGYDAELLAEEILTCAGFEVLYNPERMRRKSIDERKSMDLTIEKQWKDAADRLRNARNIRNQKKWRELSEKEKKEFENASMEFSKIDKIHHKELERAYQESHKIRKQKDFVKNIIGDSIMPEINRKEWEKVLGIPIKKSLFNLSFVDLFCKKGDDYYIFDIKHKTYKENTYLNKFTVTNYEILNYDKLGKENKIKIKIMIILEKEKRIYYQIFDWTDFIIPSKFDPHVKTSTAVRLKNGFNIDELIAL